jgi:glucose-6-phosphate 1-dehydrogenase
MSIHPDEGIVLRFQAKHPGPKMRLQTVEMKFNYQEAFAVRSPDEYETLLRDVMKNDAALFMRADQVEAAWRLLMPVLEVWAWAPPGDLPNYAAGTWGPVDTQGLPACGHSRLLPTELVGECK